MHKMFRAVPLPGGGAKVERVAVVAETDFDALDRAKQFLGSSVPFELWDGDRLALTYRPATRDYIAPTPPDAETVALGTPLKSSEPSVLSTSKSASSPPSS